MLILLCAHTHTLSPNPPFLLSYECCSSPAVCRSVWRQPVCSVFSSMKWVTASDDKPTALLHSAVPASHISPSQQHQTVNILVINPTVALCFTLHFISTTPAATCTAVIKWIEYMHWRTLVPFGLEFALYSSLKPDFDERWTRIPRTLPFLFCTVKIRHAATFCITVIIHSHVFWSSFQAFCLPQLETEFAVTVYGMMMPSQPAEINRKLNS